MTIPPHRFSERSQVAAASPWARAVARARGRGGLLDLTSGNPTTVEGLTLTPDESAALEAALSAPPILRYSPRALGADDARRAIAQRFSTNEQRVVLTASTSEAYAHLFALSADPGDVVLAPTPSYPLLPHLAAARDVRVEGYALDYDGSWHLDGDRLRAAIRAHVPRAIVSVSPNNPTGSWLERDAAAIIHRTGLPHIIDEVFAGYPLRAGSSARVTTPLAGLATGPLVVRLGGLSKYAGLPQVKLAWMLLDGDDQLVDEAIRRLEISLDAFLSISAAAQADVPGLLAIADMRRDRILATVRGSLAVLRDGVTGTSVTLLEPDAGWYAILRLPAVGAEDDFVLALLDAGVLVQPGWLYDLQLPGPAIVVSLLTPPRVLHAGLARLLEIVERASR